MTDISFLVNGITFVFAEGEVLSIQSSYMPDIENVPLSKTGPMNAYNYDYNGVQKSINIKGVLFATTTRVSGYSIDSIVEQKQWLESLCNGDQGAIKFTSNYESSSILSTTGATPPYQAAFTNTYVMIKTMNFTELEGKTDHIEFNINMMVGQ